LLAVLTVPAATATHSRLEPLVHCGKSFVDEIESAPDLTMLKTPPDPLDRLGKANTGLTITLRDIPPTLSHVLNSYRQAKPVQYMMGWPGAGRFAEQARTVGAITQDGDRCR